MRRGGRQRRSNRCSVARKRLVRRRGRPLATTAPVDSRVGTAGFEPATSASRTLRATKLRYVPRSFSVAAGRRRSRRIVASGPAPEAERRVLARAEPARGVHDRGAHPAEARRRAGAASSSSSRGRRRAAGRPGRRACGRRAAGRSRAPATSGAESGECITAMPNRSVRPRRHPEVVPLDVRVVEPEQLDRQPVEVGVAARVREVDPSVGGQLGDQVGRAPARAPAGARASAGSTRGS